MSLAGLNLLLLYVELLFGTHDGVVICSAVRLYAVTIQVGAAAVSLNAVAVQVCTVAIGSGGGTSHARSLSGSSVTLIATVVSDVLVLVLSTGDTVVLEDAILLFRSQALVSIDVRRILDAILWECQLQVFALKTVSLQRNQA